MDKRYWDNNVHSQRERAEAAENTIADLEQSLNWATRELATLRQSLAALAQEIARLTKDRDDWKRMRHAFEAQVFSRLHEELDYPDDKTALEMIDMLIEWRKAETRGALRATPTDKWAKSLNQDGTIRQFQRCEAPYDLNAETRTFCSREVGHDGPHSTMAWIWSK